MRGWTCGGLFTERDARNLRIFNWWCLSAAVVYLVATILTSSRVITPGPIAWTFPLIVAILGGGTIRAYLAFLRDADELLRKIQLEALGLAFGVGMVFMLVWRLCERAGAPKLDFSDPFIVMMICWGAGQWLGMRRYGVGEAQ